MCKHPLDRLYDSFEEAEAVAKFYLKSRQISKFFIFTKTSYGSLMFGIAYRNNDLLDFEYECD